MDSTDEIIKRGLYMGMIIQARDFSPERQAGLLKPIIYCCSYGNTNSESVSINMLMAKKLIDLRQNIRTMKIEQCFHQILDSLPEGAIIKDFDIMFNPYYQVDILKIMVMACKKKPFSVIWPGVCKEGLLFYAEEGYTDYKSFNIGDYDITCIV